MRLAGGQLRGLELPQGAAGRALWACPRGPLHDVRRSVATHMAEELGVEDR
jgi:hypothetical protein